MAKTMDEKVIFRMPGDELSAFRRRVTAEGLSISIVLRRSIADFGDAVADETALVAQCQYVVTRNARHFAKSRVPAITPERFLSL